jgi:D-3-phosphoglycerate dehydrogenase
MLTVIASDGLDKEAQVLLRGDPQIKLEVHSGVKPEELKEKLADADIAVIRSATVLNASVLEALPKLKGVLRAGVGIDNIDLKAAERLGLWVWNAPTGNYQSTAELAVGLMFAVARKIPLATEGAHQGKWLKKEISSSARQLSGSIVGVLGAGNIGLRVARMCEGLGMRVLVCDPVYSGTQFKKVAFEELLTQSDFVTIHTPVTESTKGLFNIDTFRKMKPSAILINAARGGIVKDADLAQALKENLIAGAGLDVFEREPFDISTPPYDELLKDPRVVLTPHVGASTLEAQKQVGLETAEKILALAKSLAHPQNPAPKPLNRPTKPRLELHLG